jgi:hypothetical protein
MDNFNEEIEFIKKTPKELAYELFSNDPQKPCSHVITTSIKNNNNKEEYGFEILITILLEGMNYLTNNFEEVNFENFSENYIKIFEPWLNSIGFRIKVHKYILSKVDIYSNYYCKIIIKTPLTISIFSKIKTDSNYHFLLNSNYEPEINKNNIENIYTIFINNNDVYKISFKNFYSQI